MATDSCPVVSARNVAKYYGTRVGVADVSFEVHPGDIVGFLGPNGSGKTTMMRILMGLIRPTRGTLSIFGEPVDRRSHSYRSRIGYLPGTLGLYERMTVGEFLNFLAAMRQVDCSRRIGDLAERLDLALDARISGLSKGNKQKVGVVQALMHSPGLLLLDEPTSGLDPIIQRVFEDIIAEETRKGVAIILSSHVMHEVDQLANRAIILSHGRIVVDDTVEGLKSRIRRKLRFEFPEAVTAEEFEKIDGVDSIVVTGTTMSCVVVGSESPLLAVAVAHNVESVFSNEPSLEDIFIEQTGNHQ
jgi:ABC-2 type transport system ATP-binding protein